MEYLTFVEELKKHILKNEKWNISEENYKFYPDGYNAESDIEKEFIRNTNVKYNNRGLYYFNCNIRGQNRYLLPILCQRTVQ